MIEVFKTNIQKLQDAKIVIEQLMVHFPESNINLDLEDCEKILRVEDSEIDLEKIKEVLHQNGHQVDILF